MSDFKCCGNAFFGPQRRLNAAEIVAVPVPRAFRNAEIIDTAHFAHRLAENAAVVEAEVTEILEASINSASGIKALTSTSRDGFSFINIEFETGMDLEAAANEIRDRVSRVRRRLPDDVDVFLVTRSRSNKAAKTGLSKGLVDSKVSAIVGLLSAS